MTWLTLTLALGATLRLWRVWDLDLIGEPLRKLADRAPLWLGDFLACVFCAGFWLSAVVATTAYYWGDTAAWNILCASLSVSWLLGQIHPRVETQ